LQGQGDPAVAGVDVVTWLSLRVVPPSAAGAAITAATTKAVIRMIPVEMVVAPALRVSPKL
jgi:hypothetical protein